jgi:arsenate reductase (thioredoxin)
MNILFVCIKNASRSAMAEALLKMATKRGVKVCSAGIKPGKHVNDEAVKAMREIGCDLSGHKPRHISAFSNIKFDYVAKMDVPDLGDMVTAKWIVDWDIPDPAQGGAAEYRKIREMIAKKIGAELSAVTEATKVGDGRRPGGVTMSGSKLGNV